MAISLSGPEFVYKANYPEQPAFTLKNSLNALDEKLRQREDEPRRRMRQKFGYRHIQCLKYDW